METIGKFLNLRFINFEIRNKKGDLIYKEDQFGEWEKSEYDEKGKLIYRENSSGEYEFELDGFGLVKRHKTEDEIEKSRESKFSHIEVEDSNQVTTENFDFYANNLGDSSSGQITVTKDSNENIILEKNDETNYWKRFIHDDKNNQIFLFTSTGYWERKLYNSEGQLTYHECSYEDGSPNFKWEKRTYDKNQNLIKLTNSENETEYFQYDEFNNLTVYESSYGIIERYDFKGRILSRYNQRSHVTYEYNDNDNTVYISDDCPDGTLWRKIYYDSSKNIIKQEKGWH